MNLALLLSIFTVLALCALAFSSWKNKRQGVPIIPNPPAPPVAPPAPELSCFVKGLIRSMKEVPGEWKRSDDWSYPLWFHPSGMVLAKLAWRMDKGVSAVGHKTTEIEKLALDDAFMTYLENPAQGAIAKRRAEQDAKEALRLAAERAPFEALGCP